MLRARLQRARKRKPGAGSARAPASGVTRAKALAALTGLSDEDMERTLVAALLEDEWGGDLANTAAFQKLVDDVVATIREDVQSRSTLQMAIAHLRAGPEDG